MKKKQDLIEWWFWSFYYISAAEKLHKLVLNRKVDKGLVIPVIYCFKHGLELFLKFISQNLIKKSFQKIHDLKRLRKSSSDIKFTSAQAKNFRKLLLEEKIPPNSYQDLKKYMEMRFTKLINFYSDFQTGNSSFNDKSNMLFRYPENKKVLEWVQSVDKEKLKELGKNIKDSLDYITAFTILHSNLLQKIL